MQRAFFGGDMIQIETIIFIIIIIIIKIQTIIFRTRRLATTHGLMPIWLWKTNKLIVHN